MRSILAVTLTLVVGLAARGDELKIGDAAPKLEVKEFLKGDPVKQLDKGKIYVVEFWATWCGPCIKTIPHLTELQKKHKDVTFIGVSVWEQEGAEVAKFVEKMGDKMEYRVATDAVPAGKDANQGAMAKNWMTAAAQDGIPAAFIVNGDGVVAWIGHPNEMDKPLEQIVGGKYDVKAAALKYKEDKARERKLQAIYAKIQKAMQAGDAKAALSHIDDAIKEDANLESQLGAIKFEQLLGLNDTAKALEYGRKLVEGVYKSDAEGLNNIAWPLVDPDRADKPTAVVLAFAADAAVKAVELTESKDPNVLDTLACAQFARGEIDKAIETQTKAVKLNSKDSELTARLKKFKAAAKSKE